MIISKEVLLFFATIGFGFSNYFLLAILKELFHYWKYKSFLYTSKEKEIFRLNQQINSLQKEKSFLELQIQEITTNMIKNLQEKQ